MRAYLVDESSVTVGISVSDNPYPHIVLGEGGNKRATWVAIGKRDAESIVKEGRIEDLGVIALKDKETQEPTGRYLIVASRNGADNRVAVLWRVSSGYRGSSSIEASDGVVVIASDDAWHSGRGNMGSTAEMLAVLKPNQTLNAKISGRRVEQTRARLTYDGKEIKVEFGDEQLDVASAEEVDGDYI